MTTAVSNSTKTHHKTTGADPSHNRFQENGKKCARFIAEYVFDYSPSQLKKMRSIVLKTVETLLQAGTDAKKMTPIIERNPLALQFASKTVKNNWELVRTAILANPLAIQFASNELKNDGELVRLAVSKNELALLKIPRDWLDVKDVLAMAFDATIIDNFTYARDAARYKVIQDYFFEYLKVKYAPTSTNAAEQSKSQGAKT